MTKDKTEHHVMVASTMLLSIFVALRFLLSRLRRLTLFQTARLTVVHVFPHTTHFKEDILQAFYGGKP
jgi:hypothetical protein